MCKELHTALAEYAQSWMAAEDLQWINMNRSNGVKSPLASIDGTVSLATLFDLTRAIDDDS